MDINEKAEIILAFIEALYVNGETTTKTIEAGIKLGHQLELELKIVFDWEEILLAVSDKKHQNKHMMVLARPVNVHMTRVIQIMNLLKQVHEKKISIETAFNQLSVLKNLPPYSTNVFMLANGIGAIALGLIFGLTHWVTVFLIFISACLGGLFRRFLSVNSSNLFIQAFCAAFIAGVIGGIAQYESSPLDLIAVCPCMVLIPGAHFLNSFLDFMHGRMYLGVCRLTYASIQCLAIIIGLLIGLYLFGGTLPVAPHFNHITPLILDIIAAGFAVIAYNIFFSMPWKMMIWPVIIGMIAHAIRWEMMVSYNMGLISATFLACLFVGITLNWISYIKYLPFAGLGFTAVVSMIPGVYLFRMGSGLIALTQQEKITFLLLSSTLYEGIMAFAILLAIALGLLVPKLLLDSYFEKINS